MDNFSVRSADDEGSTSASSSSSVEIFTERMIAEHICDVFLTPSPGTKTTAAVKKDGNTVSSMSAEAMRAYHQLFLSSTSTNESRTKHAESEECKTAPLFSGPVLDNSADDTFRQFGLLAGSTPRAKQVDLLGGSGPTTPVEEDSRIFMNVSAPWSAFICGSQGSGKSHTLSCMLENCLLPSKLGNLKHPLVGIVFHYDKFTSYGSNQVCEAAYLCSSGIPVKVLVSPTNYWRMKSVYENLPGLKGKRKPEVVPMRFVDKQLDVSRIMTLMAMDTKDGPTPLYIEVILRILRDIAIQNKGNSGLDYNVFRSKLDKEGFSSDQNRPLKLRLDLLESFMEQSTKLNAAAKEQHKKAWSFEPGTLTVVDLSCPFVEDSMACALFSISLELFLDQRGNVGRVVALDEAHKFMTSTAAANTFTENLLSVIRQQRHLATRVIIATQEPTISPKLLDLASMTIVHRFTSPEWMASLKAHLAGASGTILDNDEDGKFVSVKRDVARLFKEIVQLNAGEALLFSPASMLEWAHESDSKEVGPVIDFEESLLSEVSSVKLLKQMSLGSDATAKDGEVDVEVKEKAEKVDVAKGKPVKLGIQYLKIKVRDRLTADGGRSIMAE